VLHPTIDFSNKNIKIATKIKGGLGFHWRKNVPERMSLVIG
jgi:hypothetical protein